MRISDWSSDVCSSDLRVLITARNGDSLERARDELAEEFPDGDIGALIADVADDEQRRELLDWVEDQDEGLNILVNNAGGNLTRASTEYTEDEWREIFEVNLFSARSEERRVGKEGDSTCRYRWARDT